MKVLGLLAGGVAAALILFGSAAGAAPKGSALPARTAVAARHGISLSRLARSARPRGLAGVPARGSYAFLLGLRAEPTGRAYAAALVRGRAAARTAAVDELAHVHAAQRSVIAALPAGSHVLYETHAVLSGVAVYTNVANVPALQQISGVSGVYPIAPKKPSLSYSALLQRAPQAWSAHGDLGAGTSIAIIDTGVDYTHADLGGPGTTAAYQTALANDTAAPTYPDPTKVAGGYDFAGDTYDPDPTDSAYQPTPHPDPNPLDCDGHGTHVAGIAAGYGENPDGSKFTGDYLSLPTDFASYQAKFRIGPGMAPAAKLYAYKVFGCQGSTDLIAAAIDRAADPNGDGNTSDHVGVINMSLGADFASPQDADAVAANAASQLGISVVAAAGNGGDLYDAAGPPGNATRAISVANSVDAYSQIDALHANIAPGQGYGAQRSVAYDWASKPDLAGSVVKLTNASNLDGCDPITQNLTGKIVFLEWTDDDATRRCGSATRSQNAKNAGAVGAILGDDQETFSAGITGSADIPVVQVVKSGADAIRAALNASQPVNVTGTSANAFSQLIPGNNDQVSSSSSRGIGDAGNVKPDVSAVGTSVFSAAKGSGNQGISFTGTSMASPMVAGLSALVRTKHPTWSPEEVKADIMNTADQDLWTGTGHSGARYAPNRAGAGRIDAKAALDNQVLAYVAGGQGVVSASFGPVAVSAPTTLTKTIDVVNKSGSALTYGVSYDPITQVPGAAYSVSPSSVSLGAGQTKTVTLVLAVHPAQLTKPIDPTESRTQGGIPRDYVAEASGRVLLTSSGRPTLRLPVYAAPRPVATMTQPASLELSKGKVQKGELPLRGGGLNQGAGLDGIRSIVAGFELQATSGALPNCGGSLTTGCIHAGDERAADLKYVGTTSDAPEIESVGESPLGSNGLEYFALTMQGPWRTPASANEYDVYIDTNGDKKPDFVLFNTRLPGTDVFASALYNQKTNQVDDAEAIDDRVGNTDAAVFNSDTLVMPVAIDALAGISKKHPRFTYGIVTWSSFSPDPVDKVGVHVSGTTVTLDGTLGSNVLRPGVAVHGTFGGNGSPLLYRDLPRTKVLVLSYASSYRADHGKGALIVHFHDAAGHTAQVVRLVHDNTRPKVTRVNVAVDRAKRTAKVTFRGTDPKHGSRGLRFRCKLDRKRFASCHSAKRYAHLLHGKHLVQVEAVDRSGNVSKPVKRRFRS
jgi:subtilisin family serine protease